MQHPFGDYSNVSIIVSDGGELVPTPSRQMLPRVAMNAFCNTMPPGGLAFAPAG